MKEMIKGICPVCQTKVQVGIDKKGAYCLPHITFGEQCQGSYNTAPQAIVQRHKKEKV